MLRRAHQRPRAPIRRPPRRALPPRRLPSQVSRLVARLPRRAALHAPQPPVPPAADGLRRPRLHRRNHLPATAPRRRARLAARRGQGQARFRNGPQGAPGQLCPRGQVGGGECPQEEEAHGGRRRRKHP